MHGGLPLLYSLRFRKNSGAAPDYRRLRTGQNGQNVRNHRNLHVIGEVILASQQLKLATVYESSLHLEHSK